MSTPADEQKFLDELDKKLWNAADRLRSNLDAAVYKHAVLGLIFLKYVSDAFEMRREALLKGFEDPASDETLKSLATALTEQLRKSATVDWQKRESVRAKMRLLIKRLLKQFRYPPAGQESAIARVIEQAETLADQWAA